MSKAERWLYDRAKCILIQEIFIRNELMDNPDLQLKLNVEIYEDAISAAFRHLTPPMVYDFIKTLIKAYLFWCAAETKTDLVQKLRRDLTSQPTSPSKGSLLYPDSLLKSYTNF